MKRVVSLVPAGTEMVAALGAASALVGVSHECDFPEEIRCLPRVTTTTVDPAASSGAIDAAVQALRAAGRPVIAADGALLKHLAPDLILTQGLCEVCAVADGEVHRLAQTLDPAPTVIGLEATGLNGIWSDIRRIAAALDLAPEAEELIAGLTYRLRRIRPQESPRAPLVLCIEWVDPLYLAGHWVPEMVEAAGARAVGAEPGAPSRRRNWTEVEGLRPDLALVMLCGFDVPRAMREMEQLREPAALRLFRALPTWVLDGNAYTSRPGPRVVDGAERIRAALEGRALSGLERWELRHG